MTSKGFSNYAMSGFFWVIAAIPDYFKRFGFFSDKINNSTELALCLDRLAGIFFIGYFEPNTIYADIGYLTILVSIIFTGYGFYHHRKLRTFLNQTINGNEFKKKNKN